MFRPRVIPVLLLKNQGLVKTVKFGSPKYVGDPMNAIKIFNDLEADELVFLDITATKENRLPDLDLLKQISNSAFMPLAIGGGIRSLEDARKIFGTGAEKVVLNTIATAESGVVTEIAGIFGSQSVVVSIDVKANLFGKQYVFTHNGTLNTKFNPLEFAKLMVEAGAGEIIINSIDRDGVMTGYDIELIRKISDAVKIPVVALGGAGTLEHLREGFLKGHAAALAAGSMFVFHGPRRAVLINYPQNKELISIGI